MSKLWNIKRQSDAEFTLTAWIEEKARYARANCITCDERRALHTELCDKWIALRGKVYAGMHERIFARWDWVFDERRMATPLPMDQADIRRLRSGAPLPAHTRTIRWAHWDASGRVFDAFSDVVKANNPPHWSGSLWFEGDGTPVRRTSGDVAVYDVATYTPAGENVGVFGFVPWKVRGAVMVNGKPREVTDGQA